MVDNVDMDIVDMFDLDDNLLPMDWSSLSSKDIGIILVK